MRRRRAGLTLVELMIVLVILAIAATFAVPSFVELLKRQRVRATADSLVADLHYARGEAQRRQAAVTLKAVGGETSYTLVVGAASIKSVDLPPGVPISSATVTFDALRGRTQAARIDVGDRGMPWLRVHVAETGLSQLCSPDGSFGGVEVCAP